MLTKDLMDLFAVMNEAVMNVLTHYFELSKVDAEHAISIYKTFAKQTDQVVQYLSIARQYEHITKLEIPKIKHAPTSLAASLQEYIDDHDFETNRRQYLAERQAKDGGDFAIAAAKPFSTASTTKTAQSAKHQSDLFKPVDAGPAPPPAKALAPELMDFFDSIEQPAPQAAPQVSHVQQQFAQPTAQGFAPTYGQATESGQGQFDQSTNPFAQVQAPQYQQPPQPIQPNFTGAGFGGYGPQPQQSQPTGFSASNPFQNGTPPVAQFQQPYDMQQMSQPPQQPVPQPPQLFDGQQQQQQQQMQPPSSNPFRQSMMMTGQATGYPMAQPLQQQSTNPFARASPQQVPMQTGSPFPQQQQQMPSGQFAQGGGAPQLQAQPTGTNPFARATPPQQAQQTGSPANFLTPSVTGSTNPFRQSAFVNQQTGQGWQSAGQGTLGGWEQMETMPVFPRPGQTG